MRLSFVQRLTKECKDTTATRQSESQQKQKCNKIKSSIILPIKKLQPINKFKSQHEDLKQLLQILQEKQNPQSSQNIYILQPKNTKNQFNREFQNSSQPRKANQKCIKDKIKYEILEKSRKESQRQTFSRKQYVSSFSSNSKSKDNEGFNILQLGLQQFRKEFTGNSSTKNNSCIYEFPQRKKFFHAQEKQGNKIKIIKTNHPEESPQKRRNHLKLSENDENKSPKQPLKTPKQMNLFKSPTKKAIFEQKRGLQNIGNTCYINSILQCLFHIPSFNQYFEKDLYKKEVKAQNLKINQDKGIIKKYKGLYMYVAKGILSSEQEDKSTYSLKFALSKKCSLFIDWQQEDAHEFMRKLLDAMHQELNRVSKKTPYKLLTSNKYSPETIENVADQYFKYYLQRDDSFLYESLGGQIFNKVKCISCKNQSVTFDNCLDISLSLIKGKNSLGQLLDQFFGQQKLSDFYRCQFCRQMNRNSTKTTKLWRNPQILIIHLKRSQFGKKNQDAIQIPLDFLSLKNCMSPEIKKQANKDPIYFLKGIVCHRGMVQSGHYWSLVRDYGQWYQMDDLKVKKVGQTQMKVRYQDTGSSQAYILFYSLVNK